MEVAHCIWSKTCIWSKFSQNFIYYETVRSIMNCKLYFFLEECLITPTLKLMLNLYLINLCSCSFKQYFSFK